MFHLNKVILVTLALTWLVLVQGKCGPGYNCTEGEEHARNSGLLGAGSGPTCQKHDVVVNQLDTVSISA